MRYRIYHNVDSRDRCPFPRYEPGDRLVRGYEGTLRGGDQPASITEWALVNVWHLHQSADRPDRESAPRPAWGDVVELDWGFGGTPQWEAYEADDDGCGAPIDLGEATVLYGRPLEVLKELDATS
jgi:hypothetical protein